MELEYYIYHTDKVYTVGAIPKGRIEVVGDAISFLNLALDNMSHKDIKSHKKKKMRLCEEIKCLSTYNIIKSIAGSKIDSLNWNLIDFNKLEISKWYLHAFFKRYCNIIDWNTFCEIDATKISDDLWVVICQYGILTERFVQENEKYISWEHLLTFNPKSKSGLAIDEYCAEMLLDPPLSKNVPISKEMLSLDYLVTLDMMNEWRTQAFVTCYILKYEDINKYIDYVNWDIVSRNKYVFKNQVFQYAYRLNWENVFCDSYIEKYYDKEVFKVDIINFASLNFQFINWEMFNQYLNEYINDHDYECNEEINSMINIKTIALQKFRTDDEQYQNFKTELIEYLYQPRFIEKWITAGNDIEDYLV